MASARKRGGSRIEAALSRASHSPYERNEKKSVTLLEEVEKRVKFEAEVLRRVRDDGCHLAGSGLGLGARVTATVGEPLDRKVLSILPAHLDQSPVGSKSTSPI